MSSTSTYSKGTNARRICYVAFTQASPITFSIPLFGSADCCTGFLHPIIHLGFGLEFKQPAIIAEGLAQAAVHSNYMNKLFLPTEKAAASQRSSKGLVELLHEIRSDKKLSTAAHWGDDNKVRDGILVRAPEEMVKYASQYKVSEDELEEKTAEMTNAVGRNPSVPLPFLGHSCFCSIFHRRCATSPQTSQI